ncbi:prolyl aminopeptidase [Allonocardiopsis opalescens]|uniref:Proline iminopeptidase n=1 Tax=Allonocardiopsis opalescens TaxID=1144618 RepID=A0A2T0Q9C5_9ACTN|nr:prolyl aminopeptidase [Allonocardiopsis opalescens]PRY00453.1 proline iminopeptidase [Allonocardiopsis opalescens]
MAGPYAPIEPYDHGMLDVGDGHRVYWELCGNPEGRPVVVVHGGPGSGCTPNSRRAFDPERFRIVLFDQRGCGRSTPHAGDTTAALAANTTHHLIADMERLRAHLGIERWALYGGSWGCTLSLAYAQRHPERVSAIVLVAVTMTRRSDIDWLYRGVGRFFPGEWERFRALAGGDGTDLPARYTRLLNDPDPRVHTRAAAAWADWEDTVISQEPKGRRGAYGDRPPRALLAFTRVCAHYFSHGAWLEEGELLREAHRLAGIPGALVHGRLDLGGPLSVAWDLARAWPDARLDIVEDAGHTGSPAMAEAVLRAVDGIGERTDGR